MMVDEGHEMYATFVQVREVEADIADGKSTRGVLAAFVRLTRTTR